MTRKNISSMIFVHSLYYFYFIGFERLLASKIECETRFNLDMASFARLVEYMTLSWIHRRQIDWRTRLSGYGYSDL